MPIIFQKETGVLEDTRLQFAELEPLRFKSLLSVAYILGVDGKIIMNMQYGGGQNVTKGGRREKSNIRKEIANVSQRRQVVM